MHTPKSLEEKIKKANDAARPYLSCTDGSYECALHHNGYYELVELWERMTGKEFHFTNVIGE